MASSICSKLYFVPGSLVTDTTCLAIFVGSDDFASSAAKKAMNALSKASAMNGWNSTPCFAFFSNSALKAGKDAPEEALACVARMPG